MTSSAIVPLWGNAELTRSGSNLQEGQILSTSSPLGPRKASSPVVRSSSVYSFPLRLLLLLLSGSGIRRLHDPQCKPVLRIHDIFVWIRIRIPLTNGSGRGSCYFRHWPSRCQQKTNFKKKFFYLLLFEGTFTSFFKDKKSKRSHKAVEIKVFLTIFAWWYVTSPSQLILSLRILFYFNFFIPSLRSKLYRACKQDSIPT